MFRALARIRLVARRIRSLSIPPGRIEVYDNQFHWVNLGGDGEGAFQDPQLPKGYAPFNVQEVNGNLYVTYARQNADKDEDVDFPGFGFVDKFSPKGKLLERLQHGPWLNAPWAVVLTPSN